MRFRVADRPAGGGHAADVEALLDQVAGMDVALCGTGRVSAASDGVMAPVERGRPLCRVDRPVEPLGGTIILHRSRAAAEFPASSNAAARCPCHHDRMLLRCLLVDDNVAFLEAASVVLQGEGVAVVGVASSTAEALRRPRALRPDVILVDIGLGEESGFDLARLLAQVGQGGGAEVIMISARAETDYTELIADSPAAGFLAKSELSARGVRRVLGGTP